MDDQRAFRDSLVETLRATAQWRRAKFNDDLRDSRNLRSADALDAFAEYISGLAADDSRLVALARLTGQGWAFVPGQQVIYEIGRFHFHDPATTFDGFLDLLIEYGERDRGESGRFGGPQVPGDDPWSPT